MLTSYMYDRTTPGWRPERLEQLLRQLADAMPAGVRVVDYSASWPAGTSARLLIDDHDLVDVATDLADAVYCEVMQCEVATDPQS